MGKKAIIFDLDDTLRKLEIDYNHKKIINVQLRPNINILLAKLKEVKEEGIDVIICTTASTESAIKYFIDYLPEEYRDLFSTIFSKDKKIQVKSGSQEERVYGYNTSNKPVTALDDYDEILFFDDNNAESFYLKELYKDESISPDKQVIFASYQYNPPKQCQIYAYKKLAEEHTELAEKVNIFFTMLLGDPRMWCDDRKNRWIQKNKFC